MKQLGVFLLPPGWDASPSQGFTPSTTIVGTHLYTWVERGTVRVKCLAQDSLRTGSRLGSGRDSRVGAGRVESGLVRRECAGEPVDIPFMPPFHDTSSWYQDLIG